MLRKIPSVTFQLGVSFQAGEAIQSQRRGAAATSRRSRPRGLPQPPGSGAEQSRVPASPPGRAGERPRWRRAAGEGKHQPAEDRARRKASAVCLKGSGNGWMNM